MSPSFKISVKQLRNTLQAVLPGRQARGRQAPTVLVVDDEPLIVQGLAAILDREGFTVLTAFDAQSALKLVQKASPELLISDVNMPGMDGIELAMRLVTALPTMKVLLFSADFANLKVNFQGQVGNHFSLLSKPVPPQQMLDRVHATLNGVPQPKAAKLHDTHTEDQSLVMGNHLRAGRLNTLPELSAQASSDIAGSHDLQVLPTPRLNAKRHFLRTE